jgi:hypothetical protein
MADVAVAMAINLAVGLAITAVKSLLLGPPETPSLGGLSEAQGHLVTRRSTQDAIPLVYGHTRVGINECFIGNSGSNNKYLHIVGIIGEGEINGIRQIDGVDQIYLDDKLYTEYGSLVYYEIFKGTATQDVCSTLQSACPEWNDPLRYTAYIYMRLEYDSGKFMNKPDITLEVEGLKIYDPRSETTEYDRNSALHSREFITRSSKRGGMGISTSRLNDDFFEDAANYCDAKGWTCDISLYENQTAIDNLSLIQATFRGALIFSENKFCLKYHDLNYESSVLDLTDNDVVSEAAGPSTLKISQPSVFGTPNAVRAKFTNPTIKYQVDDYIKPDPDAVVSEGDYREEEIDLRGVTAYENVIVLANYELERRRINKQVSLVAGSRCQALEPHDIIRLTRPSRGWSNKYFRVTQASLRVDGNVALSLLEENVDFYNDTYDVAEHNYHDTLLPDPTATVASVINVSHQEEVYNYRGRSFTRWKIAFDPPAAEDYPWWDYAEIWVKIGSGDWKFMTKSRSGYQLDPVEEGVTYQCKMVSVSIWGTKQAFDDAYTVSKTIQGKTDAPTDLTSLTAVASGDTVNLFADPVSDPDIEGYEVRLGDSWTGGIFIAFVKAPQCRLVGVRPGTHTFWMAPKNNAGVYGESPKSAQVTVYYPSGYEDKHVWSWDFTTGSHDNTEHDEYSGEDILKCSHTDNVLTGKWTSPEYDLGAVKTVRVWGDFLTVMNSAENAWGNIIPSPMTWAQIGITTKRWYEIFQLAQAGVVRAVLKWGTVSGELTEQADFFEIIAAEINARYVQVEVTITDPAAGSYLYLYKLNMKAAYYGRMMGGDASTVFI